jgi:hypothetical protein
MAEYEMPKHDPPEIMSGSSRVVASGTVIPANDTNEVAVSIGPARERLTVVFKFEDDVRGPEPRMQVVPVEPKKILLVLRGFGTPTGDGTVLPLRLGKLGGHELSVHFRVTRVGKSPRVFHFTFFQNFTFTGGLTDAVRSAHGLK